MHEKGEFSIIKGSICHKKGEFSKIKGIVCNIFINMWCLYCSTETC